MLEDGKGSLSLLRGEDRIEVALRRKEGEKQSLEGDSPNLYLFCKTRGQRILPRNHQATGDNQSEEGL